METLDSEVRGDVETAARILAKRTVAGCGRSVKKIPMLRSCRRTLMRSIAAVGR